jgi:ankyrin repeat protein
VPILRELISEDNINMTTHTGKTALHLAVESKNILNVQELLSHGIDIHLTDNKGLSAYDMIFLYPSKNKHIDEELIKMLQYYGADFTVRRRKTLKLLDNPNVKIITH